MKSVFGGGQNSRRILPVPILVQCRIHKQTCIFHQEGQNKCIVYKDCIKLGFIKQQILCKAALASITPMERSWLILENATQATWELAALKIQGEDENNNGKNCGMTGHEIWLAYQDLKNRILGGCGSKHIGHGCLVSTDYYTQCGNTDGGVNRFLNSIGLDDSDIMRIK
jgi:hypothetical protein